MAPGDDDHLEGPDGPPGADDGEGVVVPDDALALLQLELDVVLQEVASAVGGAVLCHLPKLLARLLGEGGGGPDLAVGVGVRAAHGGALVLEDLHVAVFVLGDGGVLGSQGEVELLGELGERAAGGEVVGVDAGPVLYDGEDVLAGQVGQRQVVLGGEGEDVADALDTLGLQEPGLGIWRRGLVVKRRWPDADGAYRRMRGCSHSQAAAP